MFYLSILIFIATAQWTKSCNSSETADDVLSGEDLNGKVILTTGADGHIATALQKSLGSHNATLILACHSQKGCDALKQTLLDSGTGESQIHTKVLDLASFESIEGLASSIQEIDVLINSAAAHEDFNSFSITKDGFTEYMQINFIGAVLLTRLLLPKLKERKGKVVNIGGAIYGFSLPAKTTVADLESWCRKKTPIFKDDWFAFAKFLLIHFSAELAHREEDVVSVSLNPGYCVDKSSRSDQACKTNFKFVQACPETPDQSAAVIAAAAAWDFRGFSGSYLDFETKMLPPDAPQLFGPWQQHDPTCVPRIPPSIDPQLRSSWYDRLMQILPSDYENSYN